MSTNQGLTSFLAVTVFVCCGGLALCTSLLGFTWATGELPFGLQPLMHAPVDRPSAVVELDEKRERLAKERYGEVYAAQLYAALQAERERLAKANQELADRRAELEAFEKTATLLKKELQATADRCEALLDFADTAEQANVRRLSAILAASAPEAAAQLLLRVPTGTAARLLEGMDARKSAEVMAALASRNAQEEAAQVKEILAHFQKLSATPLPAAAPQVSP